MRKKVKVLIELTTSINVKYLPTNDDAVKYFQRVFSMEEDNIEVTDLLQMSKVVVKDVKEIE